MNNGLQKFIDRAKSFFVEQKSPFNAPYSENWHWHPVSQSFDNGRLPGSNRDWAVKAGDLWLNGTIAIGLDWIQNALLDAPIRVFRDVVNSEGITDQVPIPPENSVYANLLENPNPWYDGSTLWAGTVTSWKTDGNAYWLKWRLLGPGSNSPVIGLFYIPHYLIEPARRKPQDGGGLYYRYWVGGVSQEIPYEDVIHFRKGLDPRNTLKGISPLRANLRSVVATNEVDTYLTGILLNMGIPGAIAAPKGEGVRVDPDKAELMKEKWAALRGDRVGELLVAPVAMEITPAGFNPEQLMLDKIRTVPQETLCAALGLSSMILNLPSGAGNRTYSNYAEADSQAWLNGIVPMAKILSRQLKAHAVDLGARPGEYAAFDMTGVIALQGDMKVIADTRFVQAQAAVQLVNIGFDPEETIAALGLPEIAFIGRPQPVASGPNTGTEAGEDEAEQESEDGKSWQPLYEYDADPHYLTKDGLSAVSRETSALYAALNQFRHQLSNREKSAVQDILRVMAAGTKRIQKLLIPVYSRIKELQDAGQPVPVQIEGMRTAYERQLGLLTEEYQSLSTSLSEIVEGAQESAISNTIANSTGIFQASLGSIPTGITPAQENTALRIMTGFSTGGRHGLDAMRTLVGFTGDGSPVKSYLSEKFKGLEKSIVEEMGAGLIAGENPVKVARRIGKLTDKATNEVTTLTRTEMLRASREASRELYEGSSVCDGWTWFCAQDSRTCVCCWAMSGKKFTSDVKFGSHPSCRCSLICSTKSWSELLGVDGLEDTQPEIPDGSEVFAALSHKKQAEILGPGGYELYRAGKPLESWVHYEENPQWGPTRRVSTLAEVNTP